MNYLVRVKETIEDEKTGKPKASTAQYLVENAETVVDVQSYVTEEYKGVNFEWEITQVQETKICKVLNPAKVVSRFNA